MTAAARRSTPALRAEAVACFEAGLTIDGIAAKFGFSRGAVGWWLMSAYAERPGSHRAPNATKPIQYRRGPHVIRPFTPAEDAVLLQLEAQGLSYARIARRMTECDPSRPRRPNSIHARLITLARLEARSERHAAPPFGGNQVAG